MKSPSKMPNVFAVFAALAVSFGCWAQYARSEPDAVTVPTKSIFEKDLTSCEIPSQKDFCLKWKKHKKTKANKGELFDLAWPLPNQRLALSRSQTHELDIIKSKQIYENENVTWREEVL